MKEITIQVPDGKRAEWVNGVLTLVDEATTQRDDRPITERVKTFEDARKVLGDEHPFVSLYNVFENEIESIKNANQEKDVVAYLKLRIIAAALNEGWKPQFTEDECRWHPWFWLYTQKELATKSEDWYEKHAFRKVGNEEDYRTSDYVVLAFSESRNVPSYAAGNIGSRLCLKDKNIATYCGTQFIDLWADLYLIRK